MEQRGHLVVGVPAHDVSPIGRVRHRRHVAAAMLQSTTLVPDLVTRKRKHMDLEIVEKLSHWHKTHVKLLHLAITATHNNLVISWGERDTLAVKFRRLSARHDGRSGDGINCCNKGTNKTNQKQNGSSDENRLAGVPSSYTS